jgi:hypothetical protein
MLTFSFLERMLSISFFLRSYKSSHPKRKRKWIGEKGKGGEERKVTPATHLQISSTSLQHQGQSEPSNNQRQQIFRTNNSKQETTTTSED